MIDRTVDPITPFCTPQTYEGQLDEWFGINTACIKVHGSILSTKWEHKEGVPDIESVKLSNEDLIFREIRNKAYESLGRFFKEKTFDIENALSNKSAKSL